MPTALIGLGSNLGDRQQWLNQAIQQLSSTSGISAVRPSTWHATPAIGGPAGQPDFLNGAAILETSLSPDSLLAKLREIEATLGRVRHQPWGPRTVDLDLLLYDQIAQHTKQLELPHPRMSYRRFVLEPAAEIAGDMRHPTIGWTIAELLRHLDSTLPYVAISGSLFSPTQQLAKATATKTGWDLIEFPGAGDQSAPASPPSLALDQTIEFLRDQAALLDRNQWPAGRLGAVSSFWMEDLLAIADVLWPGALDEQWRSLSATVVPPKLLVVYEASSQQFHEGDNPDRKAPTSVAIALWHRLNEARLARASRPRVGPVLWLNSSNQALAEKELVAAIQAMS
jgi:2-amino-4-hydroxy-6-hydroxymethyldihydropteridine diphosphokinase